MNDSKQLRHHCLQTIDTLSNIQENLLYALQHIPDNDSTSELIEILSKIQTTVSESIYQCSRLLTKN